MIREENLYASYSPQDPEPDITEVTMLKEIALALSNSFKVSQTDEQTALHWLESLGINEKLATLSLADNLPMQKLTSVLATLARRRSVCLLDEPTIWLSKSHRRTIIKVIKEYLENGGIVLCATHDEGFYNDLTSAIID